MKVLENAMRRRTRILHPIEAKIFQKTMRLLENSFQVAVEADDPFVELQDLLQAQDIINDCPYFEWSVIESALESVLLDRRMIQREAYSTALEITGINH